MSLPPSPEPGAETSTPDAIDAAREAALDSLARWARAVVEGLEAVCAAVGVSSADEDQPVIAFHGQSEILHDGRVLDEEGYEALAEAQEAGESTEGFVEERETCSEIHLYGGDGRGGQAHVVLRPGGEDADGVWAEAVRCWAALREVLGHQWSEEIPAGLVLELENCVVGAWECDCAEGPPSYLVELAIEEGPLDEEAALADLLEGPAERHKEVETRFTAILERHGVVPPRP